MIFETDPVCRMQVLPETAAARYEYKGKTYYFCNPHCLEQFRPNPERFLSPPQLESRDSKSEISGGIYVCPMHPEVRQRGPGACPKGGMALEPVAPSTSHAIEYVCPMHPQIVRPAPGTCPICGMALEPRTVTGGEENAELADMSCRFWTSE